MKHLFITLFVLITASAFAQQTPPDYISVQEQMKRTEMMRELDSAVYYMDEGKYEEADKRFRYVLGGIKSVPSDLVYYFGKNSYLLGKYSQSVDWLNKYIQLKGTSGQFSADAVTWLKRAEEEVVKERTQDIAKAEEVLSRNYDIDCGPTGKVTCPVCRGSHVIVKKGPFGDEYKTCPYCNDHGILTCEEYNQLVRGELKPKTN